MAEYLISSGISSCMTFSSAQAVVFSGGTASDTTLERNGKIYVRNSGTAIDTTVNGSGYLEVSRGGILNGAIVSGNVSALNGVVIRDAVIGEDSIITASSGAVIWNTQVNEYGLLELKKGAIHRG